MCYMEWYAIISTIKQYKLHSTSRTVKFMSIPNVIFEYFINISKFDDENE